MEKFDVSRFSNIRSAAITGFTMLDDKVARVIASVVGDMDPNELGERIAAVTNHEATPVKGSFIWLERGRSLLGYMTTAKKIRPFEEGNSRYHSVTANLFMDTKDESLWELKPGVGGRYLSRQGNDNLAELLEASRTSPRGSAPRMNSILSASASIHQFVAFIDKSSAAVDYGFCVQSAANPDASCVVLSTTTSKEVEVAKDYIISRHTVDIPDVIRNSIVRAAKAPVKAGIDKAAMIEYYKKAYVYAPEYIEQIIKQIQGLAAV